MKSFREKVEYGLLRGIKTLASSKHAIGSQRKETEKARGTCVKKTLLMKNSQWPNKIICRGRKINQQSTINQDYRKLCQFSCWLKRKVEKWVLTGDREGKGHAGRKKGLETASSREEDTV